VPRWRLTFNQKERHDAPGTDVSGVVAEGERFTIGRSPQATLVCNSGACARLHCFITIDGGEAFLEDGGSSNGTWLNGQRVGRPTKVQVGDVIGPGIWVLKLLAIERAD
jgi:pSer/pThr/pTyr-binding forkhead associated (FHA) protein